MFKRIVVGIVLSLLIYGAFTFVKLYPQFPVATAYAAKKMCSCTFIAGRNQESIQKEDLGFGPLGLTSTTIDTINKIVTSSIFGLASKTAEYRGNLGCILLQGEDNYQVSLKVERPALPDSLYWPKGTRAPAIDSMALDTLSSDTLTTDSLSTADSLPVVDSLDGVHLQQLRDAIDRSFDPSMGMDSLKTRAVVVVYKDSIIAEKYANGFDDRTEILGWSMTKSITGTLIGMLAKDSTLTLEDQQLFPEWTDDRKNISLKDLMQMQSGLEFVEDYAALSDATQMLYLSENVSSIPLGKPLIHQPGTKWYYSSGTTNLLSRLLKNKLGQEAYLRFPYDSLFNRIGMSSAIIEPDESGLYVGSSYCYATPRDWAKFGLLYLNEGNWYGDQIIDTSWVDFVKIPASNSEGIYGGQFWLNVNQSQLPDLPEEVFSCNGFQGQRVFIIPSYDLVVVRMGLEEPPLFDMNKFLKEILDSFKVPEDEKEAPGQE